MTAPTAPASVPAADLIGTPLTRDEADLLAVYDALRDLVQRDLPPCAASGLRAALASTAVVVTDLGLRFEHLLDEGV